MSQPSSAPVAATFDLDLELLSTNRAGRALRCDDVNGLVGQADDVAAGVAHEVCVRIFFGIVRLGLQLEAPGVVSEVGAAHEAGVRQILQVAKDRRAVEAIVGHDNAWLSGGMGLPSHRPPEIAPREKKPWEKKRNPEMART